MGTGKWVYCHNFTNTCIEEKRNKDGLEPSVFTNRGLENKNTKGKRK